MLTLNQPDLNKLGTIWGPKDSMFQCSWLQFADDAAIVSSSVSNSQQLLDIFKAWVRMVRHDYSYRQVLLIWNAQDQRTL